MNWNSLLRLFVLFAAMGTASYVTGYSVCLLNGGIPLSAYECIAFRNSMCLYHDDLLIVQPNNTTPVIKVPLQVIP